MTDTPIISIRPATRADVPAIRDIYNDAILHTTAVYRYEPLPLEERLAWFDEKVSHGWPVLAAMDDADALVGYATVGPFRPSPAYLHSVEDSVYVHPDHRGRGIGSLLIPALLDAIRPLGVHAVIAGIDSSNDVSIRLHARFGFVEVARLREVGYKFERWLDLVLMELVLAA